MFTLNIIYALIKFIPFFLAFFPIHLLITAILFNYLRISTLKSKINDLAKPLLCGTVQSFIVTVLIIGISFYLMFSSKLSELPYVLLIALFPLVALMLSIIYSRAHLNIASSWIAGIGLYLLTFPLMAIVAGSSVFIYETARTLIIILIIILAAVQMRSIRKITDPIVGNSTLKWLYFFAALSISNFVTFYMLRYIALLFGWSKIT